MQPRIVGDALAERRQSILIFGAHQHRRVAVALRRACERVDINPDLRLKSLACRVEQTDNGVIRCLNSETIPDVESLKSFGNALRDNRFSESGLEQPARDRLKARSQFE